MNSKVQRSELVLFHKKCGPSKLRPFLEGGFSFVYLDEDVDFPTVRLNIPPERLRIFTKEFHSLARDQMANYLDFIRKEIIDRLPSDIKWLPQVSSRNAVSSPFFREYLVLCLALKLIAKTEKIVVISGRGRILQAIRANSTTMAHNIRVFGRIWSGLERGKTLLGRLVLPLSFFTKGLLLSRGLKRDSIDVKEIAPDTILRTWINKDSIDSNGCYRNLNFGSLQSHLEFHGKSVAVWPLPMEHLSKIDYRKIVSQLRLKGIKVVNPLCLRGFAVHLAHLIDFYRISFRSYRTKPLCELNVGSIINPVAQTSSLSFDHYLLSLAFRIFAREVEPPSRGLTLIYPFENNASEHYLNSLLAKTEKRITLIGYQNSAWFSEIGSMSLLPGEDSYFPIASQILINGKRYWSVFLENGFPESKLRLSANLRFSEEKYRNLLEIPRRINEQEVFLVGNFSENQTVQCAIRCKKILEEREGLRIKIKLHPLCSPSSVMQRLSQLSLSSTIELFNGSWNDVLSRASLVLTPNGSVTNLEVAAAGVPMIRLSNINSLDLDPFWDPVPNSVVADDSEAVWLEYQKWLKFSQRDWENVKTFGKFVLANYFEPISSTSMSGYL